MTKPSTKKKELSKRERIAKDNAIYKAEHEQYLKDVATCEHICSGNCRRNGCNCKCGEYCRQNNQNRGATGGTNTTSRFADKDFSRFAPEDTYTATENYKKHTNFLGEIEGEPAINCDKWTAMCVVLVLLCVVAYAMHGDYQALQSGLIN